MSPQCVNGMSPYAVKTILTYAGPRMYADIPADEFRDACYAASSVLLGCLLDDESSILGAVQLHLQVSIDLIDDSERKAPCSDAGPPGSLARHAGGDCGFPSEPET
jgi:hypothetical protein